MTTIPADTPDWLPAEQGATDTLLPYALYPLNAGTNDYSAVITCSKSYQAVVLRVQPPSSANDAVYTIVVAALDHAGNQYYVKSVSWSINYSDPPTIVLPIPLTAGGALQFTIYAPAAGVSLYMSISGCTATLVQGSTLVRSDGRPYPVGSNAVTSGATTLIAAPGAGRRLLLASVFAFIEATAVNVFMNVVATINGASVNLVGVGAYASSQISVNQASAPIPPQGLLCDDNTGITLSVTGVPNNDYVTIIYDVVS